MITTREVITCGYVSVNGSHVKAVGGGDRPLPEPAESLSESDRTGEDHESHAVLAGKVGMVI
jgi:hypothetical protein